MGQLTVLICISHIIFSERKENRKFGEAFKGVWLFDQLLKRSGVADLNSMPGNIILNSYTNKNEGTGIWISRNRSEANLIWSINEDGNVFTIKPKVTSIHNQAAANLFDYQGEYKIQSFDNSGLILEKKGITIKFRR
ncbi:MAG: hypothetical protein K0R65_299 [Crocinitomicaceae bacterium]|jgi:hypothetical protein|nr:hypothetical protein [Crocinitomicaceae bacterium]